MACCDRHGRSAAPQGTQTLCGFTRTHLAKGESKTVTLEVPAQRLRFWDTTRKQYVGEPGDYEVLVGAASDDIRPRTPLKIAAQR